MKRIKNIMIPLILVITVSTAGCKKYLDVNQNLNDPTAVPLGILLTSAEQRIGSLFAIGGTIGNGLGVYTHQLMQYGAFNRYGITATAMNGSWTTSYQVLTNLDVLIEQATENEQYTYAGIAKVLKAYLASMMVDIWGDIPYSEYNRFGDGISQPAFDRDSDIYPQLIALLDEGIENIQNPSSTEVKPGGDDIVYGGNATRWVKAANTIKLKMYTQVRLVQDVSAQVAALLSEPASLINAPAESFLFPFGPFTATDDRYPGYGDYSAAQRGGQIPSHWMYEIMKGVNTDVFTGISDPRIPYYFYRQKTAAQSAENCADYRDGGFITLIFGSNSRCVGGSNSNSYTLLGIYPIGGRYDDGSGAIINASGGALNAANAGTGAAPQRALTYADRLYLEAELVNAGVVAGDEKALFEAAVRASIRQVDYVITEWIKPSQAVPALEAQAGDYIDAMVGRFEAASSEERRLEYIMTQKWLSRLGNSADNYTDYRRTGFPKLFTPVPLGTVSSVTSPGGTGGLDEGVRDVSNGTPYPVSLPWPQSELLQNGKAPNQKIPNTHKIFWMP